MSVAIQVDRIAGDSRKWWLLFIIILMCIVLFPPVNVIHMLDWFSTDPTASDILSMIFICTTIGLILLGLTNKKGEWSIDIQDPLSFYGIFYLIYYLVPYLWLMMAGLLPATNPLKISFMLSLGYVSWYAGVRCSGVDKGRNIQLRVSRQGEEFLLLLLCMIGIGIVTEAYAWRAVNGIFFNQARFYEQELTVAASFRDVFSLQVQGPVILLLGLSATAKIPWIATVSRRLLIGFGTGIFLILILSSQTRPAVSALVFLLVGVRIYRRFAVKTIHLVGLCSIGLAAVLLIQGVRIADSEEFGLQENQFEYAVRNIFPGAISGLSAPGSDLEERLKSRAGGGIEFLSECIEKTEEKGSYLYGQGVLFSLYSAVPRFIWPGKPAVMSPQLVIELLLGMPLNDAPYGPITQFYVEGGWFGVISLFFLFGLAMGELTKRTVRTGGVEYWIFLFFIWGYAVRVEQEFALGILVTLRNALFVCALFWIIKPLAKIRFSNS